MSVGVASGEGGWRLVTKTLLADTLLVQRHGCGRVCSGGVVACRYRRARRREEAGRRSERERGAGRSPRPREFGVWAPAGGGGGRMRTGALAARLGNVASARCGCRAARSSAQRAARSEACKGNLATFAFFGVSAPTATAGIGICRRPREFAPCASYDPGHAAAHHRLRGQHLPHAGSAQAPSFLAAKAQHPGGCAVQRLPSPAPRSRALANASGRAARPPGAPTRKHQPLRWEEGLVAD